VKENTTTTEEEEGKEKRGGKNREEKGFISNLCQKWIRVNPDRMHVTEKSQIS
jgi:hypothetical protein